MNTSITLLSRSKSSLYSASVICVFDMDLARVHIRYSSSLYWMW